MVKVKRLRDNSTRERILHSLSLFKELTISQLSAMLSVSRPTIYLHLDILESQGLIKRDKNSQKKGAPVTISLDNKNFTHKQDKDIREILELINQKKDIDWFDFQKEKINLHAYNIAILRGYVGRNIYITEKGKEFLKQNEQKR